MRTWKTIPTPRVFYAERVGDDVIIEFDDGECALYPAALLLALLPQAVKIECSASEEVEAEPTDEPWFTPPDRKATRGVRSDAGLNIAKAWRKAFSVSRFCTNYLSLASKVPLVAGDSNYGFRYSSGHTFVSVLHRSKRGGWGSVSYRPSHDVRVALRATLQKLEQSLDFPDDADVFAELKRIVLHRIAEIDAAEALEQVAATVDTTALKDADTTAVEELPQTPAA